MAYASLGKVYTLAITQSGVDVPVDKFLADLGTGVANAAQSQVPALVSSIKSDAKFTVAKGALAAFGIGAAAVVGYTMLFRK